MKKVKLNTRVDRIGMINPCVKLKLVSRQTKVWTSALQTFADVFVDRTKTSVTDVLPSGQCFKRCTANDNADVTDHCQQKVASCESLINRL